MRVVNGLQVGRQPVSLGVTEFCTVFISDSVVGVPTDYGLDGSGIEPRWGRHFPVPFQTGPATHTVGTECLIRGDNGRGVVLTTTPHLAPMLKKE